MTQQLSRKPIHTGPHLKDKLSCYLRTLRFMQPFTPQSTGQGVPPKSNSGGNVFVKHSESKFAELITKK